MSSGPLARWSALLTPNATDPDAARDAAAGLAPCRRTLAFSAPTFLLGALLVVLLVPTVAWLDCARRTRRTSRAARAA